MPSKKPLFNAKVEGELIQFLGNYENSIQSIVNGSERADLHYHYNRLKNYTHNIILRRAGLETVTKCFGSRIIGTSVKDSDLDLYVQADNPDNLSEKKHAIQVLKKVRGTMERTKLWEIKIMLFNATVPILRVVFKPLNLQMDIVASNPIGVYDSDILCYMLKLQPEVKHFFHFIRMWICKFNGVKMKKMIVFYLVIFYMQHKNVLPSLKKVHAGVKKKLINGWEVQFDPYRTIGDYRLHMMDLYERYIIGFFQYYGNFDFDNFVLDMHSGLAIPRSSYKINGFNLESNMCVAAPLDRDRNVAHLVGEATLAKFKKVCANSVPFLAQHDYMLHRREE